MKLKPLLAIMLTVSPAVAAEVNQELDQVVVTASRVEEKLREAPVTINIVDSKEIEKTKFRNASEILTRIPGIVTHDLGGGSEISSIRVPTSFSNPYTIVLLDGVPVSSYGSGSSGQFSEINSDNIARIEVIKGPASAIYGSNAIGGVINIISKAPSAKTQVKPWIEYGSGEMWRTGVSGSGSGEKMSFNLDLNYTDSDGWRDHSSYDQKSGTIKLQYLANDDSLVAFKMDYLTSEVDRPGTLNKEDFEANWQHSIYDITYNNKDKIAPSLSYTHFFDQAEFKMTLALRDLEEDKIPTYRIFESRGRHFGTYYETEDKAANLQFLYNRTFSKFKSKIIAGLDSERGDLDSDQFDITPIWDAALNKYTSYTMGALDSSLEITTKVYAPFMQLQLSPIDKMKITAGGRYDSAEYEVEDKLDPTQNGDKKFTKFSPKFGVTYDFMPWLNSYFSYSKGFVVPTSSQLFTGSSANSALDPEEAENFEIGMRSSFWENKINLDAAVFTMDITDKIISESRGVPNINAGETSHDGLEVTAVIRPVEKIKLTMAYSYSKNEYDIYTPGTPEFNGNDLPRSPKHRLNVRLAVMPLKGLEVELEMDEISTQYHDSANLNEYTRPTLFNLRTSYSWQQWSTWAHVKNLTNQTYATYVSGDDSLHPGEPLSVFAGLSYKWGM